MRQLRLSERESCRYSTAERGGGMEGLEDMYQNLRLTEEESSLIELGGMEKGMSEKGEKSLVGKIWLDRRIGKDFVESTMAKVWRVSKPAKFRRSGSIHLSFLSQIRQIRLEC